MALRIPFFSKPKVAEIKRPIPASKPRTIRDTISRTQFDRMFRAEFDFEKTTAAEMKRKLRAVMPATTRKINELVLQSKGNASQFYAAFDRLPSSTKENILKYLNATSRTN